MRLVVRALAAYENSEEHSISRDHDIFIYRDLSKHFDSVGGPTITSGLDFVSGKSN